MYDNFNVDDFMAVSVFADFVLSSMLLEQSYEERAQIIQDMQSKEILQPLEEVIEEMDIFEKIGFFTFPSLLNFMDNKNKRLLFLGANFLLTIGLALSHRKSYFIYRLSKGVLGSIYTLLKVYLGDIIFWHNLASIVLIYYYLSQEKVQDDIFILSQNDYSFWKGTFTEKIAAFLKIPSYRVDQRGNFDYDATVFYNKFHKLFISFIVASFYTYVFSFSILPFIYLALFVKNSITIIRKSR